MFASADGDSLGAAPIDSGRYQIRLQVASGRVQLTYRQIGYDPQIRTVWVDHDMQEKLAPVCTVTAFGPLGATIHLPARALLDDEGEPICDYPLGKTHKPPDFGIKGNG